MHISEWSSILLNLYTNSIKAIRRANSQGQILIKAGKTNNAVYLEFADNGDGIPEQNKQRIFEPFFTTTSPSSPLAIEYDEITGMGLGLKIVKDIITSYQGSINLVTPPEGYATCFRIEIPKASKEEIEKYEY
ncbi:MAG: sensor histidine kinase [Candidatus Hodarchaeota archaeon]